MIDYTSFINDLKRLIEIPSVKSRSLPNKPFGEEIANALDYFATVARRFGFSTTLYDGYAVEVSFGEGEEIGVIGHLDVVPAGEGWETDPFELTEKDGTLFGRGICDDKAPMLLCLYALKEIKDSGLIPSKKIRLFVGGDEESGWKDAEYLKEHANLPEYGFSPDGNFPVGYAEKGMAIITVKIPKLKKFSSLKGGTVVNAVCGYASVKPLFEPDEKELAKFALRFRDGIIESVGKSSHGSQPHLGKNALKPLFEYFSFKGENVKEISDYLFNDKLGLNSYSSEEGKITFSPDVVKETEEGIEIICDCRFPHPFSFETVTDLLNSTELDFIAEEKHNVQYVDKKSPLVDALICAYNSVTGKNGKPVSQGGSTFARVFKKGVAFGPEFEGKSNFIHQPNERIEKTDLLKLYDIYFTALSNLLR